jgi:MFS superfamily sulfate permease-like transporter
MINQIEKYFPFLSWLRHYDKKNVSSDLSAGFTVAVMLIPQSMAYAMLAGLPPIIGLYSSVVPLLIYALFGSSRQLAVGPVAMSPCWWPPESARLPDSSRRISLIWRRRNLLRYD